MKKYILLTLVITGLILSSCKENNGNNEGSYLDTFVDVSIELDTIHYLDTTRVTAHTIGSNLVYYWQTSSNAPLIPIEGNDSVVMFYADPCLNPGKKYIYCTIIADNREETRTDSIILVE